MTECDTIRDRFFGEDELPRSDVELTEHLAACATCRFAAAGLKAVGAAWADNRSLLVPAPPFSSIMPAALAAARTRRVRGLLRRMVPFAASGVAVAALLVVALAVGRHDANRPILAAPGMVLSADSGPTLAVLATGVRVGLSSGKLRIDPDDGARLVLDAGVVSFEVPPLAPGHALYVNTPAAEIRVHGTRFQVASDAHGTSVVVDEGLVEVQPIGTGRPHLFARPGESVLVEPLDGYREHARTAAIAALEKNQIVVAERHLAELLASNPPPLLAAEAQSLLGWAAAAGGDRRTAIERYRRALAELPTDARPLWAENAFAELALLLEAGDPGAANATWRAYVVRFPSGVHAALARARVGEDKAF